MKIVSLALFFVLAIGAGATDRKLVLIAGGPSHGPGEHEHRAGCLLFQKCLAGIPGLKTVVYDNGWPTLQRDGRTVDNNAALDDADAETAERMRWAQNPDHLAAQRHLIAGRQRSGHKTSAHADINRLPMPILLGWGECERFNPVELGPQIAARLPRGSRPRPRPCRSHSRR